MMRSISALSLAPDVNAWLANSREPRVLHVFDHACNLINNRGEVLSIVTPQIGNGPFNLVIEDDFSFSDHLSSQSPISVSRSQLNLGNRTIHTSNAKLWSPRPDWERLHGKRHDIASQLTKRSVTNYLTHRDFDTALNDLSGLLNHRNLPITKSFVSNLQFANLCFALGSADITFALTITCQLAGLGIGLTPTGDDFILGAMYAAWIIHPPEIAGHLGQEIAKIAAPLTTSLSGAWLRSAGRGEAGTAWHQFFDSLISTEPMCVQGSINNILAAGETSGADALAGFLGAFISWAERIRLKTP